MKKSKPEQLTKFLKSFEGTIPGIEAFAVISVHGIMIASALHGNNMIW